MIFEFIWSNPTPMKTHVSHPCSEERKFREKKFNPNTPLAPLKQSLDFRTGDTSSRPKKRKQKNDDLKLFDFDVTMDV